MATQPPVTKFWIHLHHLSEKPFILRACWRKDHLTLSYAFSKSILNITPLMFFRCISWTVSCRITTPSSIFRPCIKAIWDGRTTRSAIKFNLFVATLMKILKLTLMRHMGLNYWIRSASLIFGNKTISAKFILNRSSRWAGRQLNNSKRSALMISHKFW